MWREQPNPYNKVRAPRPRHRRSHSRARFAPVVCTPRSRCMNCRAGAPTLLSACACVHHPVLHCTATQCQRGSGRRCWRATMWGLAERASARPSARGCSRSAMTRMRRWRQHRQQRPAAQSRARARAAFVKISWWEAIDTASYDQCTVSHGPQHGLWAMQQSTLRRMITVVQSQAAQLLVRVST